ncbi:methyltransferase [Novipirellula herctigrandis]
MNAPALGAKRWTPRQKCWLFRLLAVLIGLMPALFLEVSLRAIGWDPAVPLSDPFVGFQSERPLFVPSDDARRLVTAPDRLEYFRPESFANPKPANEFRIVCLGGSTVQGRPYAIETSFSTWLELSLRAADPDQQWEVINCGGVSYASYRLVPVLEEMLRYEPDLVILYTGHNEFLEDRSYSAYKQQPEWIAHAYGGLAQLRSINFLHQLVSNNAPSSHQPAEKDVLSTEVDALLDYRGGLEDYHRDPEWKRSIINHFEFNLRRMTRLAAAAKVPMVLVDPPVNMQGCPPFKVADTAGLSAEELAQCHRLVNDAIAMIQTDRTKSINLLDQAVAVNNQNAGLHYQLGMLLHQEQRFAEAKIHLQAANDEDICPLRILKPMNQIIRASANDSRCPLLEARQRFSELSKGGIPGDNLFLDHVHPTIVGHQILAGDITDKLVEQNVVTPRPGWEKQRDKLYKLHLNSLDLVYFEKGKQRLEGLRRWSQGRAKKQRVPTSNLNQEALQPGDNASASQTRPALKRWHTHADVPRRIAQFDSVFWDAQDTDTLRPMLRDELNGGSKRVLEIGTGTGWLTLFCLDAGADSAVATDINPAAVANARFNAAQFGMSKALEVRLVPTNAPSAFSVIGADERFDLIVSNPPWEDAVPKEPSEHALYDPNFQLLDSLLKGLRQHLNPGGKALLAYGSTEGIELLQQIAPKYQLKTFVRDDRDLQELPAVFLPAVVIEVVPDD